MWTVYSNHEKRLSRNTVHSTKTILFHQQHGLCRPDGALSLSSFFSQRLNSPTTAKTAVAGDPVTHWATPVSPALRAGLLSPFTFWFLLNERYWGQPRRVS